MVRLGFDADPVRVPGGFGPLTVGGISSLAHHCETFAFGVEGCAVRNPCFYSALDIEHIAGVTNSMLVSQGQRCLDRRADEVRAPV
jgi:hypothetical protein